MRLFIITVFFIFQLSHGESQIFPSGSRVCFVGNSITNNGEFHHNILLFHLTRYPKENVSFFNCGISGDVTAGILNRMEDDILIHQPTHIVLMIGMNDVRRSLYSENISTNSDTLEQREKAILNYKINLEKIIKIFLSKKIQVILQKPTIYDQTGILPTKNNLGVNDALKVCADFIGDMANAYHLEVVDYWTIMNSINQQMQKKNPSATLTSNDRVHPQSAGHLVMAYQFLKTLRAEQFVSSISLNTKGTVQSSNNCDLIKASRFNNTYSFTIKEKSLPFPIVSQQENALQLVSFQEDLNQQLFKITDLPVGAYKLLIDSILIGSFSSEDFHLGIDLSFYKLTPQYQQSIALRNVLNELWVQESNLRNIKFIEYNNDYLKCVDRTSLDALKNCLMPVFELKNTDYYKNQLTKYLLNKPNEQKIIEVSNMLKVKAFELAQPKIHQFNVVKM
jgi:lysophospholipase L1-like esterase